MTINSVNSRALVLGILDEVINKDNYSHIIINNTLKKYQYLDKQERAFISRLAQGTIENIIHLDYIINQFSKVPTNKMKPTIRNIMRMSVYQIKFMDSVPVSAACNEAVKLAEKKSFHNLKGFVNGVLRNIARSLSEIKYPDETKEPVKYLSVMYSIPEWIISLWMNQYDYSTVKKICSSALEDRGTTIRCNLNKTTPDELSQDLIKNGVKVEKGSYLSYAFKISEYDYLNKIEDFRQGKFQIQDESSMLVAEVADVNANDTIIDVCAAPGGKSTHIAEKLNGTGTVISRDLSDAKVELIQENVNRLGLKNITVQRQDALELDSSLVNKAQIVIADLPCSGLGIIGKKTDIKYKLKPEQLDELVNLQRDMLSTVSNYVANDGVLIYSTCTINPKENIDNVKWFIEKYPFELESISNLLPEELVNEDTDKGYIQLLPGIHNTDGFFIARLKRMK